MDKVAVLFAFLSAVLMATIGVFSKKLGLPPEILTFFRLFLGSLFMALFLVATGKTRMIWKWPTIPVILSGLFLAGFIIFYIQAMNFTSMANSIMLVYLAPLAASVVAHFFLNERLTLFAFGVIALALFGFAMMMEFRIEIRRGNNDFIGFCFGLLALTSYAGFILINRVIKEEVHVYTRTFWQLFTGGCVMIPIITHSIHLVAIDQIPWLAAVGFFPGFLAILFAVIALSRLPAAMFGTIAYTEAVAVVIFGWTLFGEKLSSLQIVGCILILTSSLLKTVIVEKKYASKQQKLLHVEEITS